MTDESTLELYENLLDSVLDHACNSLEPREALAAFVGTSLIVLRRHIEVGKGDLLELVEAAYDRASEVDAEEENS